MALSQSSFSNNFFFLFLSLRSGTLSSFTHRKFKRILMSRHFLIAVYRPFGHRDIFARVNFLSHLLQWTWIQFLLYFDLWSEVEFFFLDSKKNSFNNSFRSFKENRRRLDAIVWENTLKYWRKKKFVQFKAMNESRFNLLNQLKYF